LSIKCEASVHAAGDGNIHVSLLRRHRCYAPPPPMMQGKSVSTMQNPGAAGFPLESTPKEWAGGHTFFCASKSPFGATILRRKLSGPMSTYWSNSITPWPLRQ